MQVPQEMCPEMDFSQVKLFLRRPCPPQRSENRQRKVLFYIPWQTSRRGFCRDLNWNFFYEEFVWYWYIASRKIFLNFPVFFSEFQANKTFPTIILSDIDMFVSADLPLLALYLSSNWHFFYEGRKKPVSEAQVQLFLRRGHPSAAATETFSTKPWGMARYLHPQLRSIRKTCNGTEGSGTCVHFGQELAVSYALQGWSATFSTKVSACPVTRFRTKWHFFYEDLICRVIQIPSKIFRISICCHKGNFFYDGHISGKIRKNKGIYRKENSSRWTK